MRGREKEKISVAPSYDPSRTSSASPPVGMQPSLATTHVQGAIQYKLLTQSSLAIHWDTNPVTHNHMYILSVEPCMYAGDGLTTFFLAPAVGTANSSIENEHFFCVFLPDLLFV
ncbi:hypothetical protein J3458_000135 [Metarhizium acridum]|uniref:uncharacterized protein n=1 Tax=Metarhizium acridum TaxID=92637 RepID=UPI001C6AB861|nr:hypothetical protein J3458_000135 [Metarhizium acridum]